MGTTIERIDYPGELPDYGGGLFYHNGNTGMEYNIHYVVDGLYVDEAGIRRKVDIDDGIYMAATHEAVGIVNWYLLHDEDAMWRAIQEGDE